MHITHMGPNPTSSGSSSSNALGLGLSTDGGRNEGVYRWGFFAEAGTFAAAEQYHNMDQRMHTQLNQVANQYPHRDFANNYLHLAFGLVV